MNEAPIDVVSIDDFGGSGSTEKVSYATAVKKSRATPANYKENKQGKEKASKNSNQEYTYEKVDQVRGFNNMRHAIFIGAKQGEMVASQDLQKHLKEAINLKEIGEGLRAMWSNRRGDIVIQAKDEKQKVEVLKQLKASDAVATSEYTMWLPTLSITGVDSDLTKDQVIEEIKMKNEVFVNQSNWDFDAQFKIKGTKPCCNPKKQNTFV